EVRRCPHAYQLIQELARSDVSLEVVKIDHNANDAIHLGANDEASDAMALAIEELLSHLFTGLKTFWFLFRGNNKTPDVRLLQRQANYLRSAYINIQTFSLEWQDDTVLTDFI